MDYIDQSASEQAKQYIIGITCFQMSTLVHKTVTSILNNIAIALLLKIVSRSDKKAVTLEVTIQPIPILSTTKQNTPHLHKIKNYNPTSKPKKNYLLIKKLS